MRSPVPAAFTRLRLTFHVPSIAQAIHRLISRCSIPTGELWPTGRLPSTRSIPAACSLWRTSRLVLWRILSASRGMFVTSSGSRAVLTCYSFLNDDSRPNIQKNVYPWVRKYTWQTFRDYYCKNKRYINKLIGYVVPCTSTGPSTAVRPSNMRKGRIQLTSI